MGKQNNNGRNGRQQKLWIIAEGRNISGLSLSRTEARAFKMPEERIFDVALTARQLKQIVTNLNQA